MKAIRMIGKGFKELFKTIKERTFLVLGFVFTWVIPIILLADQIALTKEVDTEWKFTFIGLIVMVFVALKFYGKIKTKINSMKVRNKKGLSVQFALIVLQKTITLGGVALLLHYINDFIIKLNDWYLLSLVPIAIGLVFYLVDRALLFKMEKREAKERVDKFKEDIKGEIESGK